MAWAGSEILARSVINQFKEECERRPFGQADVKPFFDATEPAVRDGGDVSFIVLTVEDGRLFEFWWRTWSFDSARFGTVRLMGSGVQDLHSLLSMCDTPAKSSRPVNPLEGAIAMGMSMCGTLLQYELTTLKTLSNYYGGGYEIASVFERKFRKLDEVTFLLWDPCIGHKRTSFLRPPCKIIKHCYRGDHLHIRSADVLASSRSYGQLTNERQTVVRPIFTSSIDPASGAAATWGSDLVASFAPVQTQGGSAVLSNCRRSKDRHLVKIVQQEDRVQFIYDEDLLEEWGKDLVRAKFSS